MKKLQPHRFRGYTIVEVLIVLAISAVMFLIAAQFVNGKQERASFNVGVNDMASNLQQVIDQVSSGQYTDVQVNCNDTGGNNLTFSSGSNSQGSNSNCVFIGKLLHFQANNSPNYEIFTMAGVNKSSSTALPTPIDNSNNSTSQQPNLTTQESVPQNLDVVNVSVNDANAYSFGFMQSSNNGSNVTIVPVYAPSINSANVKEADAVTAIEASGKNNRLTPALAVSVCLTDGTRYATINIGDSSTNADKLSVNIKNLGTTVCPTSPPPASTTTTTSSTTPPSDGGSTTPPSAGDSSGGGGTAPSFCDTSQQACPDDSYYQTGSGGVSLFFQGAEQFTYGGGAYSMECVPDGTYSCSWQTVVNPGY